jgi:thioesterase domain-containing protein/acyl carrier protein
VERNRLGDVHGKSAPFWRRFGQNGILAVMAMSSAPAHPAVDGQAIDAEWLCVRLAVILGIQTVGPDDDFFELGGDSPAAVVLMSEIEAATGILFPIDTLVGTSTPRKLAARIATDSAQANRAADLLLPVQTEGERTPLFLVHGLHGQIYVAGYLKGLIEDRPIWGIAAAPQDPEKSEPKPVSALADDYIAALRSVRPSGPYLLAGYCAGMFVAWEMAWRLRASGEQVPLVIGIDPPPSFGEYIGGGRSDEDAEDSNFRSKALSDFRDAANLHLSFAWIRDNPRALEAAVNTAVALRQAFLDYRPRAYDGPVLFVCSENKAKRILRHGSDWRRLLGDVDVESLAKKHFGLFMPSNKALGRAIDQALKARDL